MKANLSHILFVFLLFCFQFGFSQKLKNKRASDLLQPKDSLALVVNDSITKDSIKKPKEVIDGIITHNADDYTLQNAKQKTVTLYNNAHITYQDIDLKAGQIIIDYLNNTVYAKGIKDSTAYTQRPVFKQGSQESEQDSILYNFKSNKALIYGVKTLQGEMIAYGNINKRVNDSTVYMRNLKFTTSKKPRPDYHIATDKAKLVPGKKIIVGGSNLVIADVPTPIYLPFAFFPLTKGRTSGFILPTWGENDNQGFFLQNGGYYFAISDYVDLDVTADLYSNGSWGLNTASTYRKRYRFNGNFGFSYQNLINSIRGFDDFSKTKIYSLRWSHSQDTKASPNSRISASVNISSRRFFQESLNELDQSSFLNNTFSSSINYSKTFVGTPFNMSTSITHTQNSETGAITMTLPTLQVNMNRQYPFAGKGGVKKNPIQKMGFNYSGQARNQFTTTDEEFFTSKMWKEARKGAQHSTGTSTNIKVLKYLTLSPSINYQDTWYFNTIEKRYDATIENTDGTFGSTVNDTIRGFKRFNEYNGGASLSTILYGVANFKKGKLKSIRHTVTPSVSWRYTPDFASKYNRTVQSDADGNTTTYSIFEGGIYGTPSNGISNSIGISLKNKLEAKLAPKEDDDEEEDRKITILNNLNFTTGYNMAADSLRWSPVSVSAGTRIFKDKINLNFSGRLNPYQVTDDGTTIDKFNPQIFRLESANVTANFSLSSKDFSKEGDNKKAEDSSVPPDVYGAVINSREKELKNKQKSNTDDKEKVAKLYQASIPWDISLVYSAAYSNNGYSTDEVTNHTVGFSGNLELSPKWKVGYASGYDILEGEFTYTRLNFARDLDSWRMTFNWIPFGTRTSYTFFIGVKSSLLSDLKWEKVKPADRVFF